MKLEFNQTRVARLVAIVLVVAVVIGFSQSPDEPDRTADILQARHRPLPEAPVLIAELGCNTCHSGLPSGDSISHRAPALIRAGKQFEPAHLFTYLQNPVRIRQHIGHSRMPDFQLSETESLALTRFLSAQNQDVTGPSFPDIQNTGALPGKKADLQRGKALLTDMGCLKCHNEGQEGNPANVDLATTGVRLQEAWIQNLLVAPQRFITSPGFMPSFFFHSSPDSLSYVPNLPESGQMIRDITAYLRSLGSAERKQQQAAYQKFAQANPDIEAALGAKIYAAQNCAACHQSRKENQWKVHNAPDLEQEGSRVRQDWLKDYLREPHAIRPAGYFPGSGSRMPDFKLTAEESNILANFLGNTSSTLPNYEPAHRSRFAMDKANALLNTKLPCLGCHQLGGNGGKIGPALTTVSARLTPAYVRQIIATPNIAAPHSIMPKTPLPEKTVDLLADYLLQRPPDPSPTNEYLRWGQHALFLTGEDRQPQNLYRIYCAACHGQEGNARGFNAPFLKAPPTNHADGQYMALRPDDTLFDGIYAGGYILNKSHTMPAWGQTLSTSEITSLVAYMRIICNCEGPSWTQQ